MFCLMPRIGLLQKQSAPNRSFTNCWCDVWNARSSATYAPCWENIERSCVSLCPLFLLPLLAVSCFKYRYRYVVVRRSGFWANTQLSCMLTWTCLLWRLVTVLNEGSPKSHTYYDEKHAQ